NACRLRHRKCPVDEKANRDPAMCRALGLEAAGSKASGRATSRMEEPSRALALVPAGSILPADLPRIGRSRAPRMRGRDGRVAEGARLESVYTGNRIVGSNPTPSANGPCQAVRRYPEKPQICCVCAHLGLFTVRSDLVQSENEMWVQTWVHTSVHGGIPGDAHQSPIAT